MKVIEDDILYSLLQSQTISGTLITRFQHSKFNSHRKLGPAVLFENNGFVVRTYWKQKDKRHRLDGPALILIEPDKTTLSWFEKGVEFTPPAHDFMLWQKAAKDACDIRDIEAYISKIRGTPPPRLASYQEYTNDGKNFARYNSAAWRATTGVKATDYCLD